MIPEKFKRELESSKRRAELSQNILLLTALFSGLILGTLIHEIAHIGFLELAGCSYNYSWGLDISGLHAEITPICYLETPLLLVFYSIGKLTAISAGLLLSWLSFRNDRERITGGTGAGLLISVALVSLREGDISSIIEIAELPEIYALFLSIVVFITFSGYAIYLLDKMVESQKGRTEATGSE